MKDKGLREALKKMGLIREEGSWVFREYYSSVPCTLNNLEGKLNSLASLLGYEPVFPATTHWRKKGGK